MRIAPVFRAFVAAALLLAATPGLAATTTGIETFSNVFVYSNPDDQDFSRGWSFSTTGESITALGYNDFGLRYTHRVGIYDVLQNLLASVIVTPRSVASGGYLYEELSAPLNLAAGTYYIAGTTLGQNDGWIYRANSIVTNSMTTYLGSFTSHIGVGGVLTFPATAAPSAQYLMVNFKATPLPVKSAVPEPATWMLMLAGFGMAGTFLRRQSRALA